MFSARRVTRITVSMLVFCAMAGCVPVPPVPEDLHLTYADNGTSKEVMVGGDVDVSLVGNASTGYAWEVTSSNLPYLQLVDTVYTPESGQIGSSGTYEFLFSASYPGTTTLTIGLFAPGQTEPVETFTVTITVEGQPVTKTVILKDKDNGETRTTRVGGAVIVDLVGYPESSGNRWVVTGTGAPVLQLISSSFIAGSSQLIGSPGTYHFYFKAKEAGSTDFTIGLFPPGVVTEPIQTFTATIIVR